MSATEATSEVFVTAFKALKRKQREAVLQKLVADADLAEDLADSLALEARRHQSHARLRDVLKDLGLPIANLCCERDGNYRAIQGSSR